MTIRFDEPCPNKPFTILPVQRRASRSAAPYCSATAVDLLLAAVLLNRFEPLAPHHVAAIRERLHDLTDDELRKMVQTGKWPNKEVSVER